MPDSSSSAKRCCSAASSVQTLELSRSWCRWQVRLPRRFRRPGRRRSRPEDLVTVDPHFRGESRQCSGLDEPSRAAHRRTAADGLGPFANASTTCSFTSSRPWAVASGPTWVASSRDRLRELAHCLGVTLWYSSAIASWTMKRFAAMQLWPLFWTRAHTPISIARSMSAEGITMKGSAPPSSSTRLLDGVASDGRHRPPGAFAGLSRSRRPHGRPPRSPAPSRRRREGSGRRLLGSRPAEPRPRC